jgi:hypothetical protein
MQFDNSRYQIEAFEIMSERLAVETAVKGAAQSKVWVPEDT